MENNRNHKYPEETFGLSSEKSTRELALEEAVGRMYSEEEVYNLLEKSMVDIIEWELDYHHSGDYKNLKEWFEQFKKK